MKTNKVKLILGSKGSGKSDWIYSHFFKIAYNNGQIDLNKKLYLVVPEQDTNDSQRKMMNKAKDIIGKPGILNIDVTSFSRISHDVFDILNIEPSSEKIIEDDSKTMILSMLISRLSKNDGIKFYKNSAKKIGFARKMTEVVSEFRAYGVKLDDIDKVINDEKNDKNDNSIVDKLNDLKNIYSKFNEYIDSKNLVITEDKYDLLDKRIDDVNIFDDAYVAFDGFTGFTPVQLSIFNKIKEKAKEVYVSIDIRDVDTIIDRREPSRNGVFYLSEKFAKDIGYGDVIDMRSVGAHKYKNILDLMHVEKNLYNYYSKDRVLEREPENIKFYASDNIQNEILNVVNIIFSYIKDGYQYNDIKIIVPSISDYKDKIISIFNKYSIPLFIDDTSTILNSPYIELIRAALDVVNYDFNYESVMRYVNSGIIAKDKYVNTIDNILREYGIRGYKRYKNGFTKLNVRENIDEIDKVFEKKDEIFSPLLHLYEKISKNNTAEIYIKSLIEFTEEIDLKQSFENFEEEIKEKYSDTTDYTRQIKILEKSYEVMENTIKNLSSVFDTESDKISIDEFKKMLDVGLTDKGVKSIPYGLDQIVVGDPMRSRFDNPKIQIFMGLNQSNFPKAMNDESIIDDKMRDIFSKSKIDLSQTTIETALNQRFYTYLIFTNPTEKLILSYTKKNTDGKKNEESSVISELRTLFGGKISVENVDIEKFSFDVKNKVLVNENEADTLLSKNIISDISSIVKNNDAISATTIESYNSCPYRYFLQKILSIYERNEFTIDNVDFGNFSHYVLENIFRKYKDIKDIEPSDLPKVINEELEIACLNNKYFAEISGKKYFGEHKLEVIKKKCFNVLLSSITLIKEIAKGSSFTKSIVEDNFNGYLFTDSSGNDPITIVGRVDRLETCEYKKEDNDGIYINVTDYKSGNSAKKVVLEDIKAGVSIQLVLYLSYYLNDKYKDKNAIFCGSFYFWLCDEVEEALKKNAKDYSESAKEAKFNREILSGLLNYNDEALKNIHNSIEVDLSKNKDKIKSISIPDISKISGAALIKGVVQEEVDGVLKEKNVDELKELIDTVHAKTKETLENINEGNFVSKPYKGIYCDYCPYFNICKKAPTYKEENLDNE